MVSYTSPDFQHAALITIDVQNDTLDGQPFEVPGASASLPKMQRLLEIFRARNFPIVHIVRIYRSDGSNVDLCRRQAVEQGAALFLADSNGCQLPLELLPQPGTRLDCQLLLTGQIQAIGSNEVIIYKSRWGAFFQTPLEKHLDALNINTLVFMGVNFPNCPRTSIYEAGERDFKIVGVRDALAGLYPAGEQEMKNIGVRLMTVQEVIDSISSVKIKRIHQDADF